MIGVLDRKCISIVIKAISLLTVLTLFYNCNHSNQNNIAKPNLLSEKIKDDYYFLSQRKGVVGFSYYQTCSKEDDNRLNNIHQNSTKEDLLYMLNDTCEKGFKLFVIYEIHKRYPELDSMLLNKYQGDSTLITFNTSCLGILFQQSFGKTCSNIVHIDRFNELKIVSDSIN